MKNELVKELKAKMQWYIDNADFQSFVDELGWESWMDQFTEAEDGEPITERESQAINDFLEEIWREIVNE